VYVGRPARSRFKPRNTVRTRSAAYCTRSLWSYAKVYGSNLVRRAPDIGLITGIDILTHILKIGLFNSRGTQEFLFALCFFVSILSETSELLSHHRMVNGRHSSSSDAHVPKTQGLPRWSLAPFLESEADQHRQGMGKLEAEEAGALLLVHAAGH
jgi:hypothetical protein